MTAKDTSSLLDAVSTGPTTERIPFNRAYEVGTETGYIRDAIARGHLSGDGEYTARCRRWIEERTGTTAALLVHSCTAGLELAVILAGIEPGDEVVLPSYTFTSTANAIALRGGVPVFIDIREDTLNIDERLIEAAIGPRTKAILPIHYAGVGCDMPAIMELAKEHGLTVIEDAAQGVMASLDERPLGSFGHMSAVSFHETKNVTCGEGGALLVNDPTFVERAEILREKGTDRSRFFRGEVDKYTWVDIGSSYVMSDLTAAFLWAQLEHAERITALRRAVWDRYHAAFAHLEAEGIVRRPIIPAGVEHNAHMYYLLANSATQRTAALQRLNAQGVNAVFHYVPLHDAPAGRAYGRTIDDLPVTCDLSSRLLRLPLWAGMSERDVDRVIDVVLDSLRAT